MAERFKVDREAWLNAERQRELDAIAMQQAQLRELADSIEKGVLPANPLAWSLIAYCLRQVADGMKPAKAKRGAPVKLYDPGRASFLVHDKRVCDGMTREEAVGSVALLFGVDDRTVGKEYDARLAFIQNFYKSPSGN